MREAIHQALQEIIPEQKLLLEDPRVTRALELVQASLSKKFTQAMGDTDNDGAMRRLWYTIFPDTRKRVGG